MTAPTNKRKLEQPSPQEDEVHSPDALQEQLVKQGFVKFPRGMPWAWELLAFVDEMHAKYHDKVEKRLQSLRESWGDADSWSRIGADAAAKVTAEFEACGVAVYSPPSSMGETSPWATTGPRFYVSVTGAAWKKWPDGAPPPQDELAQVLWPHVADQVVTKPNLIRGLGWALAPPHSDPQSLHADIWGDKPRPGRVRFHHILWKRLPGQNCTTQIVPSGFTDGRTDSKHYSQLETASAPCLLYDNEVLHRGAANSGDSWVSTCSIELCTRTGYDQVWKGGSEDDGLYKMLHIRSPGQEPLPEF